MKSFEIGKNDESQRLDKFIHKAAPLLPQSLLYKYIRTKRIKVNGKRAEISTRLRLGDKVDMYINDEFFEKKESTYDFLKASKHLDIIYEDENIMLLDKKVGVLCHPDNEEYVDTLIGRIKRYLYEKGEYSPDRENSFVPSLVNRIDRNTGGIVIAAKNAESLRILNQKMKDRELHKFYLCVLIGRPKLQSGILKDYLIKDEKKNTVRIYKKQVPSSKEIRTKYRVIDTIDGLSLTEVELLTGRTHQIRAHFAFTALRCSATENTAVTSKTATTALTRGNFCIPTNWPSISPPMPEYSLISTKEHLRPATCGSRRNFTRAE